MVAPAAVSMARFRAPSWSPDTNLFSSPSNNSVSYPNSLVNPICLNQPEGILWFVTKPLSETRSKCSCKGRGVSQSRYHRIPHGKSIRYTYVHSHVKASKRSGGKRAGHSTTRAVLILLYEHTQATRSQPHEQETTALVVLPVQ